MIFCITRTFLRKTQYFTNSLLRMLEQSEISLRNDDKTS